MQLQSDKSHRFDEIKTQFRAREGYYRLMDSPDYSQRSQRNMGFNAGTTNSKSSIASNEKTCIRISLVTIDHDIDTLIETRQTSSQSDHKSTSGGAYSKKRGARDRKICFNVGRELFVYNYDGVRTGPDASNPIFKDFSSTTSPTCHDFNQATARPDSLSLLVGYSDGHIQLIEMNSNGNQKSNREFNFDRLVDKTRVTCIKWLPNSPNLFFVAHSSGQLYLYKSEIRSSLSPAPVWQIHKNTDGVTIYTCKSKTTRNPIYKWTVCANSSDSSTSNISGSTSSLHYLENESCSLNEFVFSPCAKYLACVSQDGFLRVYCYGTMELIGRARSYYGGLSCVCWSPDGKYVVTGGEDDLITVWSFVERRVVARGLGHKSWVSVVSFDSFYTGYDLKDNDAYNDDDDDDEEIKDVDDRDLEIEGDDDYEDSENTSFDGSREIWIKPLGANSNNDLRSSLSHSGCQNQSSHLSSSMIGNSAMVGANMSRPSMTSYRFGSVGQDTQLCLWDLNDDLLKQSIVKSRMNTNNDASSMSNLVGATNQANSDLQGSRLNNSRTTKQESTANSNNDSVKKSNASTNSSGGFLSTKGSSFTKTFSLVGRRDRRNLGQKSSDKNSNSKNVSILNGESNKPMEDPTKLLGTPICPRMNEVPLLEPSVCKKISFERLTSLVFCRGGFITSCQDGYVFSWARCKGSRPASRVP